MTKKKQEKKASEANQASTTIKPEPAPKLKKQKKVKYVELTESERQRK